MWVCSGISSSGNVLSAGCVDDLAEANCCRQQPLAVNDGRPNPLLGLADPGAGAAGIRPDTAFYGRFERVQPASCQVPNIVQDSEGVCRDAEA